jgi:FG-GAP repeat protein/VCBS repeat protein
MAHARARVALRSGSLVLGIAILGSTFACSANAQEVLQSALGSATDDQFGWSVAMGPDLDGDGFREVAVGAPYVDWGLLQNAGAVYILSGRDFSRMQTINNIGLYLGDAVCWCGDVDGDGMDDLAIGMRGNHAGLVRIYSSSAWTQVREISGGGGFGHALADLGDANGDGVDDLIVGAYGAAAVFAYSGSDGSLLWSIHGQGAFGWSVAPVGDLDGDGHVDIAVGAPGSSFANSYLAYEGGLVVVCSGKDQSVLQSWSGNLYPYGSSGSSLRWAGDELGVAVGAAGDFDGDGVPDVWAASGFGVPTRHPYVSIFSGSTGATLRTMVIPSSLQRRAATIGDVNGDGHPEFLSIATSGWSPVDSGAFIFSSIDGKTLWEIDDKSGNGQFTAVAGDPASSADFLLGMGLNDDAAPDAGKVGLLSTNDLWLDVAPTHFPKAGDTLTFTAAEGPTGNLAMLVLTHANGTPLFTPLTFTTFDAAGAASLLTATIPSGFSGTTLTFHAFAIGAAGKVVDSIDELITLQ